MENFNFDYDAAVAKGSMKKYHLFELGGIYTRQNFQWFKSPVIANGPYGIKLRDLKVNNAVQMPVAGKKYNLKFQVVFLTYNSVTIDILEIEEVK